MGIVASFEHICAPRCNIIASIFCSPSSVHGGGFSPQLVMSAVDLRQLRESACAALICSTTLNSCSNVLVEFGYFAGPIIQCSPTADSFRTVGISRASTCTSTATLLSPDTSSATSSPALQDELDNIGIELMHYQICIVTTDSCCP